MSRRRLRMAKAHTCPPLDARPSSAHVGDMSQEPEMSSEKPPAKAPKSPKPADRPERLPLEETILRLCAERGAEKSICPTDAAKAFAQARGEDDLGWRNWLTQVRSTAVGMARQGRLIIYRKGKPADPDDFRGVYRLGLPRSE